ncbi:hypothetical protein DACRYDRAFT_112228 [Dacryopinax primogenitus]|uniref:Uncharacterized protein n=1 Tax=Dacryopinax primogenitus (strain DJM 731) TaxID=1858805 RepID=M5FZF9_DACPD|nr:uncharacterized protein DACRYDRAFT_112228 [Dacryopinax primogenitus]EJT96887.1 hypothetical protein DACRYDRAFT_112228 [Dacryopinax primogenitus]
MTLDWFYQTWDSNHCAALGEYLFQNYQQALKILQTQGPAVSAVLRTQNLMTIDLEQFCCDEQQFFENLQREPASNEKAFEYLEVLKMLESARYIYSFLEMEDE